MEGLHVAPEYPEQKQRNRAHSLMTLEPWFRAALSGSGGGGGGFRYFLGLSGELTVETLAHEIELDGDRSFCRQPPGYEERLISL